MSQSKRRNKKRKRERWVAEYLERLAFPLMLLHCSTGTAHRASEVCRECPPQ